MPDNSIQPTPYADINAVLDLLHSNAQTILGNRLVGMYLYGSLASGDFNLHTSDIDFVVVTDDELSDALVSELKAMHTRIAASGSKWAAKLEGAYVPQRTLRRHNENDAPCPAINEGQFYVERLGSDWVIQRHILREQGVVLAGPSLTSMIDPVNANDLKRSIVRILNEWWSPMLQNSARLLDHGYQPYAILSMCRALYTFQYGTIVSKPVAARWAKDALGERWANLIEQALLWQGDTPFDHLDETLAFIRFTVERRPLGFPETPRV